MADNMRPDCEDFLALFLSDTPMIDTRAPVEFDKGSFPGAVNLPLMSDDERHLVGTCYKEQGQEKAIELGHSLVCDDVKNKRVQAWQEFTEANPDGYLYCFRGGLRSQICQQWLADSGRPYPRITGGYKAMRRFLIDSMERICREQKFAVLAGQTGAAKTEILKRFDNAVDLEELAHHRGSAFGKRVGGQPQQIDFENALAIDLLRQEARIKSGAPNKVILLEDESRLIGRNVLPQALLAAKNAAPVVVVEVELETRVEHSFHNYILIKLAEWQTDDADQGFDLFAADLRQSLSNIKRRLGGERYGELSIVLEQALLDHRAGDPSRHRDWIRSLLAEYYDPLYNHHLLKRDNLVYRGDSDGAEAYLRQL